MINGMKIPLGSWRSATITGILLVALAVLESTKSSSPHMNTTNLCILTPSILHSTPICTTLLSQIKPCMMPWMNLRDILLLTVTRLHVAVILARWQDVTVTRLFITSTVMMVVLSKMSKFPSRTSEKWVMSVMTISVLSSGLLRHLTEMANGKLLAMPQLLLSVVMLWNISKQ